MAKKTVEFLYDIASPYSFVAGTILHRYAQTCPQLEVAWRPFLLGGVMHATGNKPPVTVSARIPYLLSDLKRNSDWIGVELSMPPNFPPNTLQAQRLLVACSKKNPELVPDLSFSLWKALFQRNEDLTSAPTLMNCCTEINFSEKEAEELLQQTKNPEIKGELMKTTEGAVERGAFGAPTMFVGDEMYFGSDRFHFMFPAMGIDWKGPNPASSKL